MKLNARQLSLWGGSAVLLMLVVWAFTLTGSPAHQRKLAEDRDTAKSIECLACASLKAQCPGKRSQEESTTLDDKQRAIEWLGDQRSCYIRSLKCYNYSRKGRDVLGDVSAIDYRLDEDNKPVVCGTFHFSEEEQKQLGKNSRLPREMHDYQAGKQCFTFEPKCNIR